MPMSKPGEPVPVFNTNPAEIEALLEYLRQAFETYLNARAEAGHEVAYGDAFMAVHNFHKLVVQDLIQGRGESKELAWLAGNQKSWPGSRPASSTWPCAKLPRMAGDSMDYV